MTAYERMFPTPPVDDSAPWINAREAFDANLRRLAEGIFRDACQLTERNGPRKGLALDAIADALDFEAAWKERA